MVILKWVRNQDYFGHRIQLSFKKRGNDHKTLAGGITSCVVRIMMIVYVGILFKRMFLYEDDTTNSALNKLDHHQYKPVQYQNMSRSMVFEIFQLD